MTRRHATWIVHVAQLRIPLYLLKLAISIQSVIRCCVRAAGVGCVSAAPRVGTRHFCHGSLRGFGLGLESGRVGDALLPMLRPDGWDCHSPADVKDHAPQDITIGTPLLYHKIVLRGAVELRTPVPISLGLHAPNA